MIFLEALQFSCTYFDSVKEKKAGHNLDNRCAGDTQTDIKQSAGSLAHPPCHRDPDQKSSSDALNHNKSRFSESVKEANEAEQKAGQKAVNSVCLQIIIPSCDHVFVPCKKTAEHISVEE